MAVKYYDEALADKIKGWLPDNFKKHILKPDEVSRLFRIRDDESKDEPLSLPIVALSRDTTIELLETTKSPLSFNGKKIGGNDDKTIQLNGIPISIFYQIDIYTKHYAEADAIIRELIFKFKNNPKMIITLPYNGANVEHVCYTRLLSTITDNSDIPQRQIEGQFTRWTIQLRIEDAYLFSIPIRDNWCMSEENTILNGDYSLEAELEDHSNSAKLND